MFGGKLFILTGEGIDPIDLFGEQFKPGKFRFIRNRSVELAPFFVEPFEYGAQLRATVPEFAVAGVVVQKFKLTGRNGERKLFVGSVQIDQLAADFCQQPGADGSVVDEIPHGGGGDDPPYLKFRHLPVERNGCRVEQGSDRFDQVRGDGETAGDGTAVGAGTDDAAGGTASEQQLDRTH